MSTRLGVVAAGRINNFDFIRFLAALLVIFSHSFPLTGSTEPLLAFSHNTFSFGGFAVATFFMLSGFLITKSYQKSTNTFSYFYSRFLRIYPALICLVLITLFIIGPLLTTDSLSAYFKNKHTYEYLINLSSLRKKLELPGVFINNPLRQVNGCLWTLPHEMLCYCLVAIFGLCIRKRFLEFAVLLVMAIFVFRPYLFFDIEFYHHLFYFVCGSVFFLLKDRIVLKRSTAIICIFLCFLNFRFTYIKSLAVIIHGCSFTYVLFYFSFLKSTYLKDFAKNGDFSYGLYLWGFPVQQFLIGNLNVYNSYLNFALSAIITLVLAFLSWHLIEKTALKFKKAKSSHESAIQPDRKEWVPEMV